jgi:hypothetical protein
MEVLPPIQAHPAACLTILTMQDLFHLDEKALQGPFHLFYFFFQISPTLLLLDSPLSFSLTDPSVLALLQASRALVALKPLFACLDLFPSIFLRNLCRPRLFPS